MGSAFWHGSNTYDGYSFDNNMIAVIAYLTHQASVSFLPSSSVLTELSLTPRSKTGAQVAEDLVSMFYMKPVYEWAEVLDTADLPHVYFVTFAALISTTFSLIMPFWLCKIIITMLSSAIIPKEDAKFIQEHYLPELGKALLDVSVGFFDKIDIARKFTGMIMKILYAFMW